MNAPADVAAAPYEAPAGLAGVSVARTTVSDVLGRKGFYHYRGYNAVDIARRGRVEDAWYLLLRGELPTAQQRAEFVRETAALRVLPDGVADLLPAIARLSPPGSLASLRSAISVAAQAMGCRPWTDQTDAQTAEQAARLSSIMPVLAAQLFRLASGQEVVQPRADLGYSDNYLYMITGELPGERSRYAVERYLMLTIDHGFNNSTFTSRVIASSGADLGAVVTGALGALSGPFHGGAPARVFDMLDAIGTADNAEPWLRNAIEHGDKLMGFGHRIYKTIDPRLGAAARGRQGAAQRSRRVVRAGGKDRGRAAGRAQAGSRALCERRVLRGRRARGRRPATGDVHRDVRLQPDHRLDGQRARADRRQPHLPAAGALRRPGGAARVPGLLAARPALTASAASRG